MSKIDKRLALIVPTKNRPDDLRYLLKSVSEQKLWPAQIIIVDGGDTSLKNMLSGFKFFDIYYTRHRPPSLPKQRNIGLNFLKKDIEIVAFFDDDISLCQNALDIVMKFWPNSSGEIAGVACNDISHPRRKVSIMERLFLVDSDKVGIVLPSGFKSKLCSLDKDYQVRWLIGGATFWKRDIFNRYKFDEWFCGYGHYEDVDFSYRVSKTYKLFALKDAKFVHRTKPIEKKYEYPLGVMQVVNRIYFVKKHSELSSILCYWSCLGLFLKNLFLGTISCKPKYLSRGFGILIGIFVSVFKLKRVKEKIK